jgi:hypothetical protein
MFLIQFARFALAIYRKCSISRCTSTFAKNAACFALEYAVMSKTETVSSIVPAFDEESRSSRPKDCRNA